ncbi:hypothetical protein SprV_0200750900 [Sparganum proliferum]
MEPQLNFAVVGESGVGKSALVSRFVTGTFSDQQPTRSISRPVTRRDLSGTIIKFDFADLSGRPEYRALIRGMLKNADAIVLCFDVSSQYSFEQLDSWMDEIKKYRANNSLLTLAGLKTDRSDRIRTVRKEFYAAFANRVTSLSANNCKTGFITAISLLSSLLTTSSGL